MSDEHSPLPESKRKQKAQTATDKKLRSVRAKLIATQRKEKKLQAQAEQLKLAKAIVNDKPAIVTEPLEKIPAAAKADIEQREIIFKPNDGPQTDFLAATEQELLYGGAAGGGKSYAMIVDPLRYCGNPNHRGILFRRTNDELRELIWKSKELYPRAYPGAKWNQQQSTWNFPSGAQQWFTYLDRDDDVLRYQGQAFNWIGFDELTQWPSPFAWDYMRSRLRTTDANLPLFQRGSTNPGGPGATWVKRVFIDPAPWGTAFPALDLETGEQLSYPIGHPQHGEPLFLRRFIPAKLTDNPYLYKDGRYEKNLLSLPESQRRQLLDGDWDSYDGAAFPEFRRGLHVVKPFEIDSNWIRFRCADWGYQQPGCVLWVAVDFDGNLWVYRELYHKKMTADKVIEKIKELEAKERIRYGVLDTSAFARRGDVGPSIGETMNLAGAKYRESDRRPNSRVNGKLEVHRRLALDPVTHEPRLKIFDTCVNLIRTLPMLPVDKNKQEDVDTDAEDHAYDALRYGCMSRPINKDFMFSNGNPTKRPGFVPADPTFGY